MEASVTVFSIWKLWIICRKDFQFRRSRNPGSSLKSGSWSESLSGSNGKFSTVTELLPSVLKSEILKDYLAEYFSKADNFIQ